MHLPVDSHVVWAVHLMRPWQTGLGLAGLGGAPDRRPPQPFLLAVLLAATVGVRRQRGDRLTADNRCCLHNQVQLLEQRAQRVRHVLDNLASETQRQV